MKPESILNLAKSAELLKQVLRSGWSVAGVAAHRYESVAEHTFGTIFLCTVIGSALDAHGLNVDLAKATKMAAIHDLAESFTSDIPRTAMLAGGEKMQEGREAAETDAISRIEERGETAATGFSSLLRELRSQESIEARLVRGCDILDMLIHAVVLEESGVEPRILDRFFRNSENEVLELDLPVIPDIYRILKTAHEERLS